MEIVKYSTCIDVGPLCRPYSLLFRTNAFKDDLDKIEREREKEKGRRIRWKRKRDRGGNRRRKETMEGYKDV